MSTDGSDAGPPIPTQTLRWCCFCDRRFTSPTKLSGHLDRYKVNWKLFWQMCHESNVLAGNDPVHGRHICKSCNIRHSDRKSLECHIKMVHCISGQPCASRPNSAETKHTRSGNSRSKDTKAKDVRPKDVFLSIAMSKDAKDGLSHPRGKSGSPRIRPSRDPKAGFSSGNPPCDREAVESSPVISQTMQKDAGEKIDIENVDILFEIPGPDSPCFEASSKELPRPQPSTCIPLASEAAVKQSQQRSDSDDDVEVIGEIRLQSNVSRPANTVGPRNQFSEFGKTNTDPACPMPSDAISILDPDDEIEEIDSTNVIQAAAEHKRELTHVLPDTPQVTIKTPPPSKISGEDKPVEPSTVMAQIHLPCESSLERPTAVVNPFGWNEERETTRPSQDRSSRTGYRLEEAGDASPIVESEDILCTGELPDIYLVSSDDEMSETDLTSSQDTPANWPNSARPDIDPASADLGRLTPSKIAALMNRSLLPESRQMDVLRMVDSITASDGIDSEPGHSGAAARGLEGASAVDRRSGGDVSNERSHTERMPWRAHGEQAAELEEHVPYESDNGDDYEVESPACSFNIVNVETLTDMGRGKAKEDLVDTCVSESTGVLDKACNKAKPKKRRKPPLTRRKIRTHNYTRQRVVANKATSEAPEEESHVFKQPLWECVGTIMPGSLVEVLVRDDPALAGGSESLDAMVMKVEETQKDVWCYIKFPNMDSCHNRWVTMRDILQVYRTQNPEKPRSFAPLAEWPEPGLPLPYEKSLRKRRLAFNPSPEVFKRQRAASTEAQHVSARPASSAAKKGAKKRPGSRSSSRRTSAKSSTSVRTHVTNVPAQHKPKIPTAKATSITSEEKKHNFAPRLRYSSRFLGKDSPLGAGSIMDGTADSAPLTKLLVEAPGGEAEASCPNPSAKGPRPLRDVLSPTVVLRRSKILDDSVCDTASKPEADKNSRTSGWGAEVLSSASTAPAPYKTSELVCKGKSGQDPESSRDMSDDQSPVGHGNSGRVKPVRSDEAPMAENAIVSGQDPLTLSRGGSAEGNGGDRTPSAIHDAFTSIPLPSAPTEDHLESAVNKAPRAGRRSKRSKPAPVPVPSHMAEDGATLPSEGGRASVESGTNGNDAASVRKTNNSEGFELDSSLNSMKSDPAVSATGSDAVLPVVGSLAPASSLRLDPDSSGCALRNVGSVESNRHSGRPKRRRLPSQRSVHSIEETEDVLPSKKFDTSGGSVSSLQNTDGAEPALAASISCSKLPSDKSCPLVNISSASQNVEKTGEPVKRKGGRPRKRLPVWCRSAENPGEAGRQAASIKPDPVVRETASAQKSLNSEEYEAAVASSVPSFIPPDDLVPLAKDTGSGTGSVPSTLEGGRPKRQVRLPYLRSSLDSDKRKDPTTSKVAGAARKKTASVEDMDMLQTADEKPHLLPSARCAAVLPIGLSEVSPSPQLADGTSSRRDVSRHESAVRGTPSPRAERRRSKSMSWPPEELQCVNADLDVLEEVQPRDLLAVVTRTDDDGQRWLQTAEVIRVGKKEHEGSFFVQKLTSRKWSPEWVEGDLVLSKILVESDGSWRKNPDLLDKLRGTWRAEPEEDQYENEAPHASSERQSQAPSYTAPVSSVDSIEQTSKRSLLSSMRMQGTADSKPVPCRDPPAAQNTPAASSCQPPDSKDAFQQLFSRPNPKDARSPSPESKYKVKELLEDLDVKTTLAAPSGRKSVSTQLLSRAGIRTARSHPSDCNRMFTRLLLSSDIKTEKLKSEPSRTKSASTAQTETQPRKPRLFVSEPVGHPQPSTSVEPDGLPPAYQYWSKTYNPKHSQIRSSCFPGMTLSIPRLNVVEYERAAASMSSETTAGAAWRECGSGRRGIRRQSLSSSGASGSSEGSVPLPRSSVLFSARLLTSEKQEEATPTSAAPVFPSPVKMEPTVPDEESTSRRGNRTKRAHYSAPAPETERRGPETKAKRRVGRPSLKSSVQQVRRKYLKQSRTVAAAACRRSLRTTKVSEPAVPTEQEAPVSVAVVRETAAEPVTTAMSSEVDTAGPAGVTDTERADSASTAGSEKDATVPTIELNARSLRRLKPGDVVYVSYETMEDDTQFIYPAKVLLVNQELYYPRFRIHYLGWGKRYDEWIASEVIHSIVDRSLLAPTFRLKQRVVRPNRTESSVLYRTLRPCSVDLSLNNICYFSALRKERFTVDDRRIMELRAAVRYRKQAQPPVG